MKALILNGMRPNQHFLSLLQQTIESFLRQRQCEVQSYILHEQSIPYCRGDFFCWVRTPGECTIKGIVSEIGKAMIHHDVVVYLSPVTFGGFSSVFKRMLDHQLGLLLPFLKQKGGETRHTPRYEKFPAIAGIGYLPESRVEQERLFAQLIETHARNLNASGYGTACVYDGESDEMIHVKLSLLFARTGMMV